MWYDLLKFEIEKIDLENFGIEFFLEDLNFCKKNGINIEDGFLRF